MTFTKDTETVLQCLHKLMTSSLTSVSIFKQGEDLFNAGLFANLKARVQANFDRYHQMKLDKIVSRCICIKIAQN